MKTVDNKHAQASESEACEIHTLDKKTKKKLELVLKTAVPRHPLWLEVIGTKWRRDHGNDYTRYLLKTAKLPFPV